ncbi:MAG: amidohydrolase family protein [Cyanobacteria bacterium REEB67]|nr:amidohydrolase family protein [Cyanobacteria bacterium REEB67]
MNYNTPPRFLITADWIFPVTAPAIKGGGLVINGEKIEAVVDAEALAFLKESEPELAYRHYKNAAVLPGLINLHTHLDYSNLAHLSDFDGPGMFDWLESLVELSRSQLNGPEALVASALSGAREAALAGTSYIVDSTFSGASALALAQVGLKGLVGLELFGLDESCADFLFGLWESRLQALQITLQETLKKTEDEVLAATKIDSQHGDATAAGGIAITRTNERLNSLYSKTQPISVEFLKQPPQTTPKIRLTIAPHAPYTVSPALWAKAKNWAQERHLPLTCHLAESENEHNWIAGEDDRLHQYLLKVMPKNPQLNTDEAMAIFLKSLDWKGRGASPVEHLQNNSLLNKDTIAAHCLKASEKDIAILAEAGVKIALCPRSNRILKNGIPNSRAYEKSGVTFGLGTDSRASSPNLDLRDEARLLELSQERLLALLTIEAAKAVGLEDSIGSLAAGKCADLAVFDIGSLSTKETSTDVSEHLSAEAALADIFEQRNPCRLLLVDGRAVVSAGQLN